MFVPTTKRSYERDNIIKKGTYLAKDIANWCNDPTAIGSTFNTMLADPLNRYYMNTRIRVYLTFNGNCREAMSFYRDCLGGELNLQTIGESPLAEKMPPGMKACILHATLTRGDMVLMASDMAGEQGLVKGNTVSLMLDCSSEEEIKTSFERLSAGGQATHPLENSFLDALFGNLTDKFGNHWLLHYNKNE